MLLRRKDNLKKQVLSIIMLVTFTFCACNKTKNIQGQIPVNYSQQAGFSEIQKQNNKFAYEILNKVILDINSVELISGITEEMIYQYSEEVKGDFVPVLSDKNVFPNELINMLEKAFYNSCSYNPEKLLQMDTINNSYFETIKTLESDKFRLSLEDLYDLFPEIYQHRDKFKSKYDAYKFLWGSDSCIDMFHINLLKEDNYIFVYKSGGSNGTVSIALTRLINNKFVILSEFETQNSGFGEIIQYKDDFYYIFLHYNYNLKNYDGIELHKLGLNYENEAVLIKYLPEKYIWKNVYSIQTDFNLKLDDYIESIKSMITSDKYLENGLVNDIAIYYGDETEDTKFVLTDENNQYHKIDFANLGVPIYIRKSNHIPSDYRSTWYLKAKFYIYDSQNNSAIELNNLELGKYLPQGIELVQLWFKKINDKIFTFRIYRISDYNYMLNVILLEGNKITQIRTDIFSPQRTFKLTENLEHHS